MKYKNNSNFAEKTDKFPASILGQDVDLCFQKVIYHHDWTLIDQFAWMKHRDKLHWDRGNWQLAHT